MQPFSTHTGMVMPLDRVNVDTDQMVPKQFLKALTRQGFGRILFYDWRYFNPGERVNPDFVMNFPRYKGASVLLARANFGCGSSREQRRGHVRQRDLRFPKDSHVGWIVFTQLPGVGVEMDDAHAFGH